MRLQISPSRILVTMLLMCFCVLFMTTFATAQDEQPAPQFLYRDGNRLILVNGYTGETTELPLEVTDQDRFEWSPDGQYLLALFRNENLEQCFNLYDVDAMGWLYDDPVSCAVGNAIFFGDSTRIIFSTSDDTNAELWLFNLADETRQEIYQTTDGISDIRWSPTETYLLFERYASIMGGTHNSLVVMQIESQDYFIVNAPNTYYASYNPIWSEDDRWFLITLKDEYVTSGAVPRTNHQGDVYLINTETGEQYRLTYTPAIYERDVRWTEDGGIAFTQVIEQETTFTLEEALNVEVVPYEQIVIPEPVDIDDFRPNPLADVMFSPDPNVGAWVSSVRGEQSELTYELRFGYAFTQATEFSIPIPEDYRYSNILIGWRPSDYPYSRAIG